MVSVTVKVIWSPTLGVALLTVLATARSACCGVSVALAVLLAVFGSNWSASLIVAGVGLRGGADHRGTMSASAGRRNRPCRPSIRR